MTHADVTPDNAPPGVPSPRYFYRSSLSESEQLELPAAYEVEGLADEIATLRVKLKTALDKHPEDLKLMQAGVGLLVKAVAAQYRLSPKAKKQVAARLLAALKGMEDQFLPAAGRQSRRL